MANENHACLFICPYFPSLLEFLFAFECVRGLAFNNMPHDIECVCVSLPNWERDQIEFNGLTLDTKVKINSA